MNDFDDIIIFGCGGHSRSVADVVLSRNPHACLTFVDENAMRDEKLYGFDIVRDISLDTRKYFFALGDNDKRKLKFDDIGSLNLITVLSTLAYISRRARILPGCFVGNFCHVGPDVEVGYNTILNTSCIVEHEVSVGNHCHIGPNATISGRCTIGDLVFVGVGSTVKDKINICSSVVIGAGSTVVNDILEPGIYIGTPARKLREYR